MAEFWNVVESQTQENGDHASLVNAYDSRVEALSSYYGILSAAAISTIPYHAAFLINSKTGIELMEIFDRG